AKIRPGNGPGRDITVDGDGAAKLATRLERFAGCDRLSGEGAIVAAYEVHDGAAPAFAAGRSDQQLAAIAGDLDTEHCLRSCVRRGELLLLHPGAVAIRAE